MWLTAGGAACLHAYVRREVHSSLTAKVARGVAHREPRKVQLQFVYLGSTLNFRSLCCRTASEAAIPEEILVDFCGGQGHGLEPVRFGRVVLPARGGTKDGLDVSVPCAVGTFSYIVRRQRYQPFGGHSAATPSSNTNTCGRADYGIGTIPRHQI